MDYFEEMKDCYNRVTGGCWCTATRKKYLDRCKELLTLHPDLGKYYILHEESNCVSNRIRLAADNPVKEFVQKMFIDKGYTTTYRVDCLKVKTNEEHFAGLYIVGDIKYDPTYGKVFLMKCGGSNDIEKRMKSYTTHNPMFFHDGTSLPCHDWQLKESTVQHFLERVSIGVPPVSDEWYILPEDTYYSLCELFKDKMFFASVASGRWLF